MSKKKSIKVYWCALPAFASLSPFNHHFIGFVTNDPFKGIVTRHEHGFMTYSVTDGKMDMKLNIDGDIKSLIRCYAPTANNQLTGALQRNMVPPLNMSDKAFANKVLHVIRTYNNNVAKKPLPTAIIGKGSWSPTFNCATVVNSVFKAAGVSKTMRDKCGEFDFADWGEEVEIEDSYFR